MTVKQFFKSTAFKCIATLLIIVLICTVFLTVCNSIFYVSAEEKFDRAITKIYGKPVATEEITLSGLTTDFEYSSVNEAYTVEDGNYLIKSTGKEGFGGSVTCWVVVLMEDGAIHGIKSVVVDSAPGESYLSKCKDKLAEFSRIEYTDGFVYEVGFQHGGRIEGKDYIKSGASLTMRAVSNAVNGAIEFVKAYAEGGNA